MCVLDYPHILSTIDNYFSFHYHQATFPRQKIKQDGKELTGDTVFFSRCVNRQQHSKTDLKDFTDGEIYLCVTQSIYGDVMLNRIEKFKVAILHLNRDWNH